MKKLISKYESINKLRQFFLVRFFSLIFKVAYYMCSEIRKFLYRIAFFPTYKLPVKVVCIGNITLGGTGKTSLVVKLANSLKVNNRDVVIINRGYGSKNRCVKIVGEGMGISELGDEPYMLRMATDVPIVVGRDRYKAGLYAVRKFKPRVILLDDGLQHLKVYKDLKICCVDALFPLWRDALFPYGTLREPLDVLRSMDLIVLTKLNLVAESMRFMWDYFFKKIAPNIPVVKFSLLPEGFYSCYDGSEHGFDLVKCGSAILISSIGNPVSFEILVRKLGINVISHYAYVDHYLYNPVDVKKILKLSGEHPIITTKKDFVKLSNLELDEEDLKKMFYLEVRYEIEEGKDVWEEKLSTI